MKEVEVGKERVFGVGVSGGVWVVVVVCGVGMDGGFVVFVVVVLICVGVSLGRVEFGVEVLVIDWRVLVVVEWFWVDFIFGIDGWWMMKRRCVW